jgi:hypothetical protein
MILPELYHWSPAERFDAIHRDGLVAGSPSAVASGPLETVCLSPDPKRAWQLSGAMDWVSEVDEWDLWLVTLADKDEVMIRAEYGPEIQEIKVRNSIPRERLWYIGRRHAVAPGVARAERHAE